MKKTKLRKRDIIIKVLFIIYLIIFITSASHSRRDIKNRINTAEQLMEQEDYLGAYTIYREICNDYGEWRDIRQRIDDAFDKYINQQNPTSVYLLNGKEYPGPVPRLVEEEIDNVR